MDRQLRSNISSSVGRAGNRFSLSSRTLASPSKPKNSEPTRPKFSIKETLDIIKKIQAGNYDDERGLEQFCKMEAPSCSRNMMTEFSKIEDTKKNTPAGKAKTKTKPKPSQSGDGAKGETKERPRMFEMRRELNLERFRVVDEDYSKLPKIYKEADQVIVEIIEADKEIFDLAKQYQMRKFAKLLKAKTLKGFFDKIKEMNRILRNFNKLPETVKAKFFFGDIIGSESTRKKDKLTALPCDVRLRDQITPMFGQMTDIVGKLAYISKGFSDDKILARVKKMKDTGNLIKSYLIFMETTYTEGQRLREEREKYRQEEESSDDDSNATTHTTHTTDTTDSESNLEICKELIERKLH